MVKESSLSDLYEAVGNYKNAMSIYQKELISPLASKTDIISEEDHKMIFGKIQEFLLVLEDLSIELNEHGDDIGIAFVNMLSKFDVYLEYDFTGRKRKLAELRNTNSILDEFIKKFEGVEGLKEENRNINVLINWPAIHIGKLKSILSNIIEYTEENEKDYKNIEKAFKGLSTLFDSLLKKQREYTS